MPSYPSDLEIAHSVTARPIHEIAERLGLTQEHLEPLGRIKAKVPPDAYESRRELPDGKLILVTSINPTPAGEGKTTTSIGLADAMNRLGHRTAVCLREPSLGPCFGIKGGAAGGGWSQVIPMEEINLHFTGDFHAITSAHNLLAAMLDNHLHHGNALGIDPRRVTWRRVLDLNDRALRRTVIGLGGMANSVPRENGFDITVTSEIMAILCLSMSLPELKERLGRIIVAETYEGRPVTAADLKAHGAMAVLLKEAIKPNLVQTLEGTPAFIHGGPFANIAHGCNSLMATRLALKLADYTVTEAGFGADLGAEKFLNIKCRKGSLRPDAIVIVATVRALKYHGGVEIARLAEPNPIALEAGLKNLERHVRNMRTFGPPIVVAINSFPTDTPEEIRQLAHYCDLLGVKTIPSDHWARGGAGAENLAAYVVDAIAGATAEPLRFTYPDAMPLWQKVETICRDIYGADGVTADLKLRKRFDALQERYGRFPICMAKTQYSLSADPALRGAPQGFTVPIYDVRVATGAEFLIVLTGEIMTMPGLPKSPAAERIDIDDAGNITGLF